MQDQAMAFSNRTGNELFRLLVQRARDELPAQSGGDRNTAMLGAALITVAELLRESVERGEDLDKLVAFSSHWLRLLLEQAGNNSKDG